MRYAAEAGAGLCAGVCAVFSAPTDGVVRYVCISDHVALRSVSAALHKALGGRGGGSDRMIQGSIPHDPDEIREFFTTI